MLFVFHSPDDSTTPFNLPTTDASSGQNHLLRTPSYNCLPPMPCGQNPEDQVVVKIENIHHEYSPPLPPSAQMCDVKSEFYDTLAPGSGLTGGHPPPPPTNHNHCENYNSFGFAGK